MPRTEASRLTSVRTALGILTGLAVGYLAVVAAWPGVQRSLPPALAWFGRPNSAVSIGLVTLLIVLFAAMLARGGSAAGAPVAIVAGLASISAVLGVASYWRCQDDSHPDFFTPLVWTAQLVKGGNPVGDLDAGACPSPVPVALNIAQLSALAAVFLSVVGVAVALLQSRLDRLRTSFAHAVTAVVDLDDDGQSMLTAIAGTCWTMQRAHGDHSRPGSAVHPGGKVQGRPCPDRGLRPPGDAGGAADLVPTRQAVPALPRRLSESVAAAPHQRADGGGGRHQEAAC